MSGICFAAIAPHGPIAVLETCTEEELELAAATRDGFAELGRRFAAARPDAVIVATPHNVHVSGAMAVVVAGSAEGGVAGSDGRMISLSCSVDLELARQCLDALEEQGIPARGVSFGGNRVAEAVMPLDWGALIPLWHMGGRSEPQIPVVVVSPARDLAAEAHVRAGKALASAASTSGKRVAFVASADHGHAHSADGPYGFDPASARYDELVVRLVSEDRLEDLLQLDAALVEAAAADSFWQLLMLQGATAGAFAGDLLSYEAPTYYGMLCASFTPASPHGTPGAGKAEAARRDHV